MPPIATMPPTMYGAFAKNDRRVVTSGADIWDFLGVFVDLRDFFIGPIVTLFLRTLDGFGGGGGHDWLICFDPRRDQTQSNRRGEDQSF